MHEVIDLMFVMDAAAAAADTSFIIILIITSTVCIRALYSPFTDNSICIKVR